MKKRFIFPSLLLGTLLALPGNLFAEGNNYEIPDVTMDGTEVTTGLTQAYGTYLYNKNAWYGVVASPGVTTQGNFTSPANPLNGEEYRIGKIDISNFSDATIGIGGVYTTDLAGNFFLDDITVKGSIASTSGAGQNVFGFKFTNYSGQTIDANKTFTGSISSTGKIDVENTGTNGEAYGVNLKFLSPIAEEANIAGDITLGDITVKGNKFASAMIAGEILKGAEVKLGNLDVTGEGVFAVHINKGENPMPADTEYGTLDIASIKADAQNVAIGFYAGDGGSNPLAEQSDSSTKVSIGWMDINSDTADAYGIYGGDMENITLKDNVTITAENGNAVGIQGTNVDVNVDGNVKIDAATAAFKTTDAAADATGLMLNLAQGSILDTTASGIESAKAVTINGGTFNSGFVKAGGVVTANNSNISISKDAWGDSVIHAGAGEDKIVLNNTNMNVFNTDGTAITQAEVAAGLTNTPITTNGSSKLFTDFVNQVVVDADGNISLEKAKNAMMTTGYVQAMRMHHNYTTWNAVRDHFIVGAPALAGYRGQECDPCDPVGACDPCGSFNKSLARNAWVSYVARSNEYDDLHEGIWNYSAEGVQTGTDLYRTQRSQIGMLFGYEGGRMRNTNLTDRIESDNMYVGLYGSRIFRNGWDVRGSFSYGWQDFDQRRLGQNLLNQGTLYYSSFKGRTTESNLEFGKRLHWRGNWSLRPVLGVDIYTNNTKAANEYDAAGALGVTSYGKSSLTQVFLRTGAELNWQRKRLGFNSGLFYSYDLHGEDLTSSVIIRGQDGNLSGTALGRELLTFNVGGSYMLAKNLNIFGGYRGESVLDGDGDGVTNTGYIGASWKW